MRPLVSALLRQARPNAMLVVGVATIFMSFFYFFYDVIVPTHYDTSIMIVGDSISQGLDGDFTWRYHFWHWLDANGLSVKFVGPYLGTQKRNVDYAATIGSDVTIFQGGGYSSSIPYRSRFWKSGRKHFSAWGRQIAQDVPAIHDVVAKYQPEHLLVELGFNDMAWAGSKTFDLLQSIAAFIENARAARPNLVFAIANMPHRYRMKGFEGLVLTTDEYNSALPDLLRHMSTPESPIHLVQFRENYWCTPDLCPSGYDGLHPNALGEYQIAQAFAKTIKHGFGWPVGEFTVPEEVIAAAQAPYRELEALNRSTTTHVNEPLQTPILQKRRSR